MLSVRTSALSQQNLGPLVARAVIGLFALLCGNAYIVGINQIYDVKIDEINKFFLPRAATIEPKGHGSLLLAVFCLVWS